ncbi:MAG: hypothetical protein ACP5N3_01845 [Candidatus Nanoarchaeia archaeon]
MSEKYRWSRNRGSLHRKKKAQELKEQLERYLNPGPKGTRYFYSYSEEMLARAILDSGMFHNFYLIADKLQNFFINIQLPAPDRDFSSVYGVIYASKANLGNLFYSFDNVQFQKFGHCQENPVDKELSFLAETKDAANTREYYHDELDLESDFVPAGLLGRGLKISLNEHLYDVLYPLIGVVYRESCSQDSISEKVKFLGFHEVYNLAGNSALRMSGTIFGKAARNDRPYLIRFYTNISEYDFIKETGIQNLLTE